MADRQGFQTTLNSHCNQQMTPRPQEDDDDDEDKSNGDNNLNVDEFIARYKI